MQGKTAGEALNETFRYGGKAGTGTAIVNEALLGTTPRPLRPHPRPRRVREARRREA